MILWATVACGIAGPALSVTGSGQLRWPGVMPTLLARCLIHRLCRCGCLTLWIETKEMRGRRACPMRERR